MHCGFFVESIRSIHFDIHASLVQRVAVCKTPSESGGAEGYVRDVAPKALAFAWTGVCSCAMGSVHSGGPCGN